MAVRQLPHLFVHIQIKKHVVDLEMLDESQPNISKEQKDVHSISAMVIKKLVYIYRIWVLIMKF